MGIVKYSVFCAPALHFTDTMTDFAAAAEFWLVSKASSPADCGYVDEILASSGGPQCRRGGHVQRDHG